MTKLELFGLTFIALIIINISIFIFALIIIRPDVAFLCGITFIVQICLIPTVSKILNNK